MIYGIGTDIVEVARIRELLARYDERFARRVLGPEELAEFRRRRGRGAHGEGYAARYLAKRFAAKEAFSKAVGRGIRHPVNWHNVSVENARSGKPQLVFSPALDAWLKERRVTAVHVSLTDETALAAAYVIVECAEEGR